MCELFELKSMMHFICGYIQENWDRYMKDVYDFIENIVNGNINVDAYLGCNANELAINIFHDLREDNRWEYAKESADDIIENVLNVDKINSVTDLFNELKYIEVTKHPDKDEQEPMSTIITDMIFIWPLMNGQTEIPDLCVPCFDITDFNLVSADDTDRIKRLIESMKRMTKQACFDDCEFYDLVYLRINAIRIGLETCAAYSGKDYSNIMDYIDSIDPDGLDIEEGDEYD